MEKRFLTPKEIANEMINIGVGKANLKTKPMILLGILAGAFIGFGGLANTIVSQTLGSVDAGLAKFMGASVFPVGLMLVVIAGAELFTGNNLMTLAFMNKRITLPQLFRNWGIVWLSNFLGSICLVVIVYFSGILSPEVTTKAIGIAETKANLGIINLIMSGILCNILVVLAVWMATSAKDIVSKIFSCWFPVMLFVLCGFEHSIANMYFIPIGMILGADVTITQLFTNLIFVTIGNIIGGGIIIPLMYNNIYINTENKLNKSSECNN